MPRNRSSARTSSEGCCMSVPSSRSIPRAWGGWSSWRRRRAGRRSGEHPLLLPCWRELRVVLAIPGAGSPAGRSASDDRRGRVAHQVRPTLAGQPRLLPLRESEHVFRLTCALLFERAMKRRRTCGALCCAAGDVRAHSFARVQGTPALCAHASAARDAARRLSRSPWLCTIGRRVTAHHQRACCAPRELVAGPRRGWSPGDPPSSAPPRAWFCARLGLDGWRRPGTLVGEALPEATESAARAW